MEPYEENFKHFRKYIQDCLLEKDINYFMDELNCIMDTSQVNFINLSDRNKRVDNFIAVFDDIKHKSKYTKLRNAANKHNKWIYEFLNVNLIDFEKCEEIVFKWIVLDNTLKLIKNLKESFVMDENFIHHLFQKEIISKSYKEFLLCSVNKEGEETALYELFQAISMRDPNWYGNLLYVIGQQNCNFINILCPDINNYSCDSDSSSLEEKYLNYAKVFIDKHLKLMKQENSNTENMSDDTCSDYGSYTDDDVEISTESLEEAPRELVLKKFQLELAEIAISGKNVIIYAPTGSGKTNVAVYIANDHLEKNPNAKIAFLVHRIPLVTQQYKVFKKYARPNRNIIDIRGKSDKITGPLIAHLDTNDIIIMTSDILRNALTVDDGNKISSISKFSLIFIDECHNCMKGHPYTRIMQEYFKEKRLNPKAKLPQIVGLTASPRSNKKDDIPGIKKSLFELCANLDCFDISMTKINKTELEDFVAQPKQTTIVTGTRTIDDFERLLIKQMENCESKLMKMKVEKYFPPLEVRGIPTDKYRQDYVGFVGNLERLNTVTIDENDGKQKAYSIYRYLNAFYRGLIVNQMFDQDYAKRSIKKYLNHSGRDFTCSFDEEFYKYYEDEILSMNQEQSSNPVIGKIIGCIHGQLSKNSESRILIFVREIDFTCYLVDILKSSYDISAEAIVGSNAKTDLKVCSDNDIDNILTRFHSGTTKVLVATTVVEEGLDVALCNMVISYGHVTNETAMIQRRGRVRALDSEYILILPPMLHWLERKELLNEHRKTLMMKFISQLENLNRDEMVKSIRENQYLFLNPKEKKPSKTIQIDAWNFSCKNCQTSICTSDYIRIIERAHRICIIPKLLEKFTVVKEERQAFGSQGLYEYGGKVLCIKCQNFVLGNYIYYKKIPYFQLHIKSCNLKYKNEVKSLKKWDEFGKYYELKNLSQDEQREYLQDLQNLGLLGDDGDIVQ